MYLCPIYTSMLPMNFQLNIFILEAKANYQTFLQSLKQRARESAWVGTF